MAVIRRLLRRLGGRLSTKLRIAIGLVLLLLSLMVGLIFIGLVPDEKRLIREGRTNLSEAVAANITALISVVDRQRLEAVAQFIVERNSSLLSMGVRQAGGEAVVIVGDHDVHWQPISGDHSVDTQVQVPIWNGSEKWGQVELRFADQNLLAVIGLDLHPQILLVLVIGGASLLAFYFYLSRTLRHLDPSRAVPPRVRAALDTMAEGLMVVDLDGYVVLANQAFASIVGRDADDIIGDKAIAFPWSNSNGEHILQEELPWAQALQQKRLLAGLRVHLVGEGGKDRSFNVNCSPVLGDNEQHGGVLVSLDDVTILEEKEVQLRESRDEAQAANRAKSAFLANMSHEIRTPMNAILGFTEVLRRGYDRGEQEARQHLDTIHSSGEHLLALINDILDLSKVESGKLEVERISTSPHVTIREVVKVLGVKAREKNIFLDLKAAGPIPETISTDAGRVRQIVTNLVGNAIKFTEAGGVTVVLRVDESTASPMFAIDIVDTGIGMSEAALQNIFNPFEQADKSVTRRFGGTGLGLSISKQFAEALGGQITVRSAPGQGSTFSVTLDPGPLDSVPMLDLDDLMAQSECVDMAADRIWRFPPSRVLVVDDGKQNRSLVKLVLEQAKLQVAEAENGQVAVDRVSVESFDLILMDINMPVMDGFTALERMRGAGLETPIFALTADVMNGFEDRFQSVGFNGFISKPINFDVMLDTLAQVLGAEKVPADVEPEAAAATDFSVPAEQLTGPAGPPLFSRLPMKDPRYRAIVQEFIDELEQRMISIDAAWAGGDFEALRVMAHYLKGAGGSVGFDAFTEPAAHLEELTKAQCGDGVEAAIAALRGLAARVVIDAPETEAPQAGKVAMRPASAAGKRPVDHGAPIYSHLAARDKRFRVIVEEFVEQLGGLLEAIDQAWAARDFATLKDRAHYLKGAGGSVGFDEFTEPATKLDQLAKAGSEEGVEELIGELHGLAARLAIGEADSTPRVAVN